MRYGTHHFVTREAARLYYISQGFDAESIDETLHAKLMSGEIAVGKPPLKPGQRHIRLDNGLRWGIEDAEDKA